MPFCFISGVNILLLLFTVRRLSCHNLSDDFHRTSSTKTNLTLKLRTSFKMMHLQLNESAILHSAQTQPPVISSFFFFAIDPTSVHRVIYSCSKPIQQWVGLKTRRKKLTKFVNVCYIDITTCAIKQRCQCY